MLAAGQVATATGDQFYVTHCTTTDSVMNAPGYNVRASSVADDPDMLKRALEYPPYELPLDMWREKPGKAQTPRRLARTRHPNGGVWIVHSVYLEKDTMNRDRSYFTHLIGLPASVDPASVLESWDAEAWVKEYPQGASKTLRKSPLPRGNKIGRETLSAFLASASVAGPTELSVVVCPARFRSDAAIRRTLVGRFLKAVILLTAAREAGEPRDRLFVHAEPGLVAMLLYAATRILPPAFTADITFSTFEPAHRSIRDYKLATVVGTYLGLAGKGLDHDLVTSRGFGVDTIQPERSSPQLADANALPAGVSELIDLAAAGEWDLLEDVHKLLGSEPKALDRVPAMIPLARAEGRLKRGGVTREDMLALKADRRGTALTQRAEEIWKFLKDAVLTDPGLRAEFKDFLAEPERLKVYRREACEALAHGDLDGWDTRWAVVREVSNDDQLKVQTEHAQKNLDKHLPTLALPARERLRAACSEAGAWPDHHILAPTSLDELDSLLAAIMPPAWQGYTCFAVMGPDEKNWLIESTRAYRPAMRERVRNHLMQAPSTVLAGYLKQAKDYISTMPGFLYDLLRPFRPECISFLSRAIDAGVDLIETPDWAKLLGEIDVYGERTKDWEGFLLRNDHLAKLLGGFKADPAATKIWDGYLNLLGPELMDGDKWETEVYTQLSKARATLGAANILLKNVAPAGGVRKLNSADTLLAVLADSRAVESMEPGQLLEAFQMFGIDPLEGLRKIYIRGNFHSLDLNSDPNRLTPFASVFRSCFPVTHEYYTARTAVTQWVLLSASCPDVTRGVFQTHFIREYVPVNWHQNILNESPRIPFDSMALALIGQGIQFHARIQAERYDRPADEPDSEAESDDNKLVSEATKRARGGRSSGAKASTGRRRRRVEGVPSWVWLLLVVFGVVVIAGVAISQLNKTPPKSTEPDTPPVKVEPKKDTKKPKDKGNT